MTCSRAPARVGDSIAAIDTPALLVDLDRFERNLALLLAAVQPFPVRVRAHAKSHKCVAIARRQIAAGVAGLCVQKTSEAEVFVAAGIGDVLVTNEVVAPAKLLRLAQLARAFPLARVGLCVDDLAVVPVLAQACAIEDARLDVYVELDVGQNRCGVASAGDAVAIARALSHAAEGRLRFMGLHAYHGSAQHRRAVAERRAAIDGAAQLAQQARAALLAAGLPCERITGGGSGTFLYEAASGVYNEVQPGSFVLMDADYARNEQDPAAPQFGHALLLLASVISARGTRATLDAGLKAIATDSGPPEPAFAGWRVAGVSDEHTVLHKQSDGPPGPPLALADKVRLIPGHCDPTVNLHDWLLAVRGDRVEEVWPVEARGALF